MPCAVSQCCVALHGCWTALQVLYMDRFSCLASDALPVSVAPTCCQQPVPRAATVQPALTGNTDDLNASIMLNSDCNCTVVMHRPALGT